MKGYIPPYSLNGKDLVQRVNMKGLYRFPNARKKVKEVFLLALNYIILDIIDNDICFVSPDGYSYKIHMKEYDQDHLMSSIRNGYLSNADVISTGLVAYHMVITLNYRSSYDYPVLLGKMTPYINELVNQGKRYYGIQEKGYKEYVDLIHSKFPQYTKEEINRILRSGFTCLQSVMKYYPSVCLYMSGSGYCVTFGYVRRLLYKYMNYACDKMFKKIFCRLYLINPDCVPKEKYWYMKISNKEYEEYLATGYVTISFQRKMYKILDCARLRAWRWRKFIKVEHGSVNQQKYRFSISIYRGYKIKVLDCISYDKYLSPEDLQCKKGVIREKYY